MGNGCTTYVFFVLVLFLISPIIILFSGDTDGLGFSLILSGIAVYIFYLAFKSDGKESTSGTSTGYRPSGSGSYRSSSSSSQRVSGSNGSSDKDDMLDAAIAAGLTYSVFSDSSDGDDDFDVDDDNDIDDWDSLYCEYKDDDIFDDDWDDW